MSYTDARYRSEEIAPSTARIPGFFLPSFSRLPGRNQKLLFGAVIIERLSLTLSRYVKTTLFYKLSIIYNIFPVKVKTNELIG